MGAQGSSLPPFSSPYRQPNVCYSELKSVCYPEAFMRGHPCLHYSSSDQFLGDAPPKNCQCERSTKALRLESLREVHIPETNIFPKRPVCLRGLQLPASGRIAAGLTAKRSIANLRYISPKELHRGRLTPQGSSAPGWTRTSASLPLGLF